MGRGDLEHLSREELIELLLAAAASGQDLAHLVEAARDVAYGVEISDDRVPWPMQLIRQPQRIMSIGLHPWVLINEDRY